MGRSAEDPEDLLEVRLAATLVGRHPETVRRWVWSGRLPAQRRGNRLLVARSEVEAIAAANGPPAVSLAAWTEQARTALETSATDERRGSAADLVIEDRRRRSDPNGNPAGR